MPRKKKVEAEEMQVELEITEEEESSKESKKDSKKPTPRRRKTVLSDKAEEKKEKKATKTQTSSNKKKDEDDDKKKAEKKTKKQTKKKTSKDEADDTKSKKTSKKSSSKAKDADSDDKKNTEDKNNNQSKDDSSEDKAAGEMKKPGKKAKTADKDVKDDKKSDKDDKADKKEGTKSDNDTDAKTDEKDDKNSDKNVDKNVDNNSDTKDSKNTEVAGKEDKPEKKEPAPSENEETLKSYTHEELLEWADKLMLLPDEVDGLKKPELIKVVAKAIAEAEGFKKVKGILDILQDGYGFLRCKDYMPSELDVYVPIGMIRKNGLRKGDEVAGETRPPREGEKYAALATINFINEIPLEDFKRRPRFSDLTPIFPDDRLVMEHGQRTTTARVIDLVAPIGKGQRGLIVSPPKAGKTTILKDIAAAISANNPEVHLMCLLVDERPEEVTDMERSIDGEVISSTFDMPCENHIAIAELTIERAKRLVECGRDVVILLDSITRLARAYNLGQPASGRVLSGGVDSTALYPPKRFLGAARNIEHGGSLTILASALIETGSKMDEVIFEEFKGTGNMELKLDRSLADRRIYPAIDPITSGTRKEDLLLDPQEAPLIWAVRRILANLNNTERAMDMLIKSIKKTSSNQEFLIRTAKRASKSGDIEGVNRI